MAEQSADLRFGIHSISTGNFVFRISSWESEASNDKRIEKDKGIRLSWTIGIYADCLKHKEGFEEALDYFNNRQENKFESSYTDSIDKETQDLLTISVADNSQILALYFTIAFEDNPEKYFELDDSTGFYMSKPDSIYQSNCYEKLSFLAQKFELLPPEDNSK